MATVKLGTTKTANKALSYAEKKAEVASGVDCLPKVAQAQMKATRELHGKNQGIQAHTVIQSFEPGEVSPREANEVGKELAERIAPGHECMIYTHTDREHTHNHVVINAVHAETGTKYQAHGQAAIQRTQQMNDEICRNRGLSVPDKQAEVRHTLAEQELLTKGEPSWKDEIRQAVDQAKEKTGNMAEFRTHLAKEYEIETRERGATLSYKHPDRKQAVRGNKLGAGYQKEELERGFERQAGAEPKLRGTLERDQGTQRTDAELHSGADERGRRNEPIRRSSLGEDSNHIGQSPSANGIDAAEARKDVERKRRALAERAEHRGGHNREEQPSNAGQTGRTGPEHSKQAERAEQRDQDKHERHAERIEQNRVQRPKRQQGLSR